MGLDVTAISNAKFVSINDDIDREDLVSIYENSDFPHACTLDNAGYYSYSEKLEFRAGSYSGYNQWREYLAALVDKTPKQIWDAPNFSEPFVALINFSDCEGAIDSGVSAKLASDFAKFDEVAKTGDEWFYSLYQKWHKAFVLASNNGYVMFH